MEIILGLALALITWIITLYITYVMAAICVYLCQEWKYTMRNLKRELRQGIWDIEWQLKLMKGK